MSRSVRKKANSLAKANRTRLRFRNVALVLCVLVAAGVSYALINPATTQKAETFCGYEEHIHGDECYEKVLICGLPESADGHVHSDECYAEQTVLTCTLPETDGHIHSDACWEEHQSLVCTLPETDGHIHTEECFTYVQTLICTEEHEHTAECYMAERVCICGLEECAPHHHDENCYVTERVCVCGLEECEPHHHDENCYTTERVLVCGLEECEGHIHGDSCYAVNYENLTCGLPEHEHTLQCFSNPAADLETASAWEQTFSRVELTTNWSKDVIAIAQTQLGYAESASNYMVMDDGVSTKGYSRYGAWYGDSYGDWCAMFCSFCMNYAGVDENLFPFDSNCDHWIYMLGKEEINLFRTPSEYIPNPGDLVFFDWGCNGSVDHVGFVAELKADGEGNLTEIRTLEGNNSDRVMMATYRLDDSQIAGYGQLPANPNETWIEPEPEYELVPISEEEQTSEELPEEAQEITQTFTGEDYTVVATYDSNSGIPENAVLQARKLQPGTEEYEIYYQQTIEAMIMNGQAADEASISISFMEFYDIGFYVDGVEIEPTGAVSIVVTPNEAVELQEGDISSAIHFGQNGTEVLDTENGENSFSFVQGSFSVTAVVVSNTTYTATNSVSDGDEVIVATYRSDANGTCYYLTSEGANNPNNNIWSLKLTTDKSKATVWTVSNNRLKYGDQYLNIWDGGSSLTPTVNDSIVLVSDNGFWQIKASWGNLYLNQFGGSSGTFVAGYGTLDDGSKWTLLKKGSSTPAPAYTVTKEASGTPEKAGDTISYTIKVTNTGNVALSNVSVAGSMDGDTGSTSNLAVGATYTKSFNYTVTQADATAKKVTNTITSASATYNGSTVSPTGNLPSVETTVAPQPISGAPAVGSITGVQTDKLTVNEWYIIYSANGYALDARGHTDGEGISTMTSKQLSQYGTSGTVTYTGSQDVVWQWTGSGFRNRYGDFIRAGGRNQYETYPANLWTNQKTEDIPYNLTYNSTYRILYNSQDFYGVKYNKLYMTSGTTDVHSVIESSLGTVQRSGAQSIYLAQVTNVPSYTSGHDNHPRTSVTGVPGNNELVFYNFDASSGQIQGLAGVEYTMYDSDGNIVAVYKTTSDYVVTIPKPGNGTYTIQQTAVPDGYVVVRQDKTFTVSGDNPVTIGSFYDYKPTDYMADKTASVVDYINRTYQIDLKTKQNLYDYSVSSFNFSVLVDQSNSMLFPSQLTSTGKTVTFTNSTGDTNANRLEALNLDKNQLYYVITDESNTSTVYAVFYDGSGWVFQDASLYAIAQNKKDGELYNASGYDFAKSGESFNTNGNGGGDISQFGTGVSEVKNNGSYTYTIYTGSRYNRLHDLQQAMVLLVNNLASLAPNTTLRLETFNWAVQSCDTYSLGNANDYKNLIYNISAMTCDGGTRQDLALKHLIGQNVDGNNRTGHSDNHLWGTGKKEYVLLITDGAPQGGSKLYVPPSDVTDAAYAVKNCGADVTLITVGLSMKNVQGGSQMLQDAATSSDWSYAAEAAGDLSKYMTRILTKLSTKNTNYNFNGEITDEISDSFYPINKDTNEALDKTKVTYIDLNGNVLGYTKPSNSTAYGAVSYNSTTNTWEVNWNSQAVNAGVQWNGRVYVKAKEDFIGGNTIDTNKSASVTLKDSTTGKITAQTDLETPTVNVKLLEFNEVYSEETIFLGDKISVQEKIEALKDQLKYTKLVNNGSDTHNKSDSSTTDGLETGTFTLPYAWGEDLTAEQWESLIAGRTVTIEYTYDNPSSHGPVGYFTLTLTKTGDTSNYSDHASSKAGKDIETYTLTVVYTPYEIGTHNNERKENVHNGTAGPGTEVTQPETHTNTHKVTVVDGKLTINKEITKLLKSESDQTFTFRLSALVENEFVDTGDTVTVTVPAGSTSGTVNVTALKRGTYKIEEVVNESAEYYVKESNVVSDGTNCEQNDSPVNSWIFTIGSDAEGNDLIVYADGEGYHPVYSSLREGYTGTSGVSYETVRVLNDKVAYTAEIPVEKIWQQVDSKYYENKKVYVVLYQNNAPVYDDPEAETPKVMALELSDDNDWQGKFTVALPEEGAKVEEQGYSLRELSNADTRVSDERTNQAIIMNAAEGDPTVLYYEDAVESGVVYILSGVYNSYSSLNMVNGVYTGTVINQGFYELPKSGGSGVTPYVLCGLLLTAGAVYGYVLRRRRERRQAKHLL